MKHGLYLKLAWQGIRRNRRLYVPYLLTCIGVVLVFYILSFLSECPMLQQMSGGGVLSAILAFGAIVVGIFSFIFLLYTNSFLVRRRMTEFGLYNILGMNKRNLARILTWETLLIAAASLLFGLAGGVVLSKLAELALAYLLKLDVYMAFTISTNALWIACIVFAVIFLVIYLNSLRILHKTNAINLMHSENLGEKPPRANWVFGVLGVLILGGAYWLAVSIQEPISALAWFFVAVVMVIVATYLLFISGSVVLCRILQKNKRYYYKANHFVSVSSMAYRMKRNGAGLASICILATMVLVMIASTTCLYIGTESSLRSRYPRDIVLQANVASMDDLSASNVAAFRERFDTTLAQCGIASSNRAEYRYVNLTGTLHNGVLTPNAYVFNRISVSPSDTVCQAFFVSLSDYNAITGEAATLQSDECIIATYHGSYGFDTFAVDDLQGYRVVRTEKSVLPNGDAAMDLVASYIVVIPDFDEAMTVLTAKRDGAGNRSADLHWWCGVDSSSSSEAQKAFYDSSLTWHRDASAQHSATFESFICDCVARASGEFYETYGGLFFIGILLSIVFICAAVLMIFYKQITEGYEDQKRFDIMQKVGMTKHDIKKSINSQLLTVFFVPLLLAGAHLAFAFPLISKLLALFNLSNTLLLALTTSISFVLFALLYTLIYRITSNSYYKIVSDNSETAA